LKADIHPEYLETTLACACGNEIKTRSTVAGVRVNVCSQCHPFFTGRKQQIMERGGRIEQFKRRYNLDQEDAPAAGAAS
jgi:large subunit ribosomal protein L31